VSAPEQFDASLDEALESAVELCRRAMADYRAGLIDEHELRCLVFRAGLVQWPDQAWLLDLRAGRWWRYDGVGMSSCVVPVTSAGVVRLRDVVDELSEGVAGHDR
jgi:hypothetical protein